VIIVSVLVRFKMPPKKRKLDTATTKQAYKSETSILNFFKKATSDVSTASVFKLIEISLKNKH